MEMVKPSCDEHSRHDLLTDLGLGRNSPAYTLLNDGLCRFTEPHLAVMRCGVEAMMFAGRQAAQAAGYRGAGVQALLDGRSA